MNLTESELWYVRRAMQMADQEGGWLWADPPESNEAVDLDKLYTRLGGKLHPGWWGD